MARYKKFRSYRPKYYYSENESSLGLVVVLSLGFLFLASYFISQLTPVQIGLTVAVVFICGFFVVHYLWKRYQAQRDRLRILKLVDIDHMTGREFEKYIAEILRDFEYKVDLTPDSKDFGADLVIEKEGCRQSVQLKRHKGLVGIEAIYQAVGSKAYYECTEAGVITNSFFTSAAKKLAEVNNCWLVDRNTLKDWVVHFQTKKEHGTGS
jgi:restriction system protein